MSLVTRFAPPRKVEQFTKTEVDEAETPDLDDFVDFWDNTPRHKDGLSTARYALFPDLMDYPLLRFLFTSPTLGGTVEGAVLTVYAADAQAKKDDEPMIMGTAVLADGKFPGVDVPNIRARWWVGLSSIAGSGAEVSVGVRVQPFYDTDHA